MVRHMHFDAIDPSSNPPFAELFFLPFQISYRIIFNKNEWNNQKVENKVSGRVREGLIDPINKIIIYTQCVIIAYCFIMYYNTEVQIIATICNK